MAKDRLAEFRGGNNNNNAYELTPPTRNGSYQQSPPQRPSRRNESSGNTSGSGSAFYDETQKIKRNLDKIRGNIQDLQGLHRKAMVEVNGSQTEYIKQQISRLTDANSDLIRHTQGKIKGLSQIPGESARVKDNQQKQLAKKLMDIVREFQSVQQDAKKGYRSQMERQYKIARPHASPDEVAEAVDNPNGHVFQQEIMSSRIGEQRRLLEDVRSRNNDIQKIEQSIEEVFQLFQDMQMLLDNQQVLVDSIDQHVDDTVAHLEEGGKQLTSAIEHAKSARRKKWILVFIILIILIIIGIVVYIYVIKPMLDKNNGNDNNTTNTNSANSSKSTK